MRTRKSLLWAVILVLMAAFAWSGGQGESEAAAESEMESGVEPIRIGVLAPLSGAFAGIGEDNVIGVRMALDEVGYEIAGRPVELFIEDTQIDPDVAIEKARALVNRDKVHAIVGPLSGGTSLAVKNAAFEWPDVTILPGGAANLITMKDIAPNVYRNSFAAGQPMYPLAEWAYENGIRTVATIGEDYAFPWDQVGGFAYVFCEMGGTITDAYWTPIGTADFSSIIAELDPDELDAVLVTYGGTDAINFVKQMNDFGLIGKVKLLGGSSFADATTLAEVGQLMDGTVSGSLYSGDIDSAAFEKFDEEFRRREGRPSSLFAENFYAGTKWIILGAEEVGGNIEDQEAFREAMAGIELDAPRGDIYFDEYHNPVGPMYLNRVQQIGGEWRNSVFDIVPEVGQYWTYSADEFNEALPFGRDTPICN